MRQWLEYVAVRSVAMAVRPFPLSAVRRAALLALMAKYGEPGTTFTKLELQKLAYFLQEAGQPLFDDVAPGAGVGLRVQMNKRARTNICIDVGVGRQAGMAGREGHDCGTRPIAKRRSVGDREEPRG